MAARELQLQILRKGRREDVLTVTADPADTEALRRYLTGWLEGHKWAPGLWPQFELTTWTGSRLVKVRA